MAILVDVFVQSRMISAKLKQTGEGALLLTAKNNINHVF